ncbi:hypothetical protein CHS0354_032153 [Potamilus streckersoni]|uniref:Uncharacterized protein n=1 Tax=Potamilus streckersoni TaxID=2493646 RepID=A0AAE0WDY8_9BIVA|nr:hypothetical protein CHS0354_032153 [Potamilus streckersoni]
MMATTLTQTNDEQSCPICLGPFHQPKQLKCAHTFCQGCLQSYITTEVSEQEHLSNVKCPVCRKSARPAKRDTPTSEWASHFPDNMLVQSVSPTKSKVDRFCDACNSEGVSVPAEGFCAVCKEAMCTDCVKCHKKQTVSKNHIIIKIEELTGNIENVMKCMEGFTCTEHDGEDIKFYCQDHKVACCATCFLHSHKTCSKEIDLKEELPALLHGIKPKEIIAELKKMESHLNKFMEINNSNHNDLEFQVNGMTDKIRHIREKINAALDDLEKIVKTEGCRIYKEEAIKKQEENHQCLALVHAVRNSHFLIKTVHKYGSDIQKFLMTEKIESQLQPYYNQIREKYEMTNIITVELEFAPLVESIFSLSSPDVGKLLLKTVSKPLPISLRKPTKDCIVERVDVINVEAPGSTSTHYTAVTFLPGDKVMLADHYHDECILLNPSYKLLASYKLTGRPVDICCVDDQEVAITSENQTKIQIISVRNDIISPARLISTTYDCYGIAAAEKGEMFVTGDCGNDKYQLSRISTDGEVKSFFKYDATSGWWCFVATDRARTRVYITISGKNSLLCFSMDGKMLFSYSPDDLRWPLGITVDRDGNIYVPGYQSNNIHQLTPDGSLLKLITNEVPQQPRAICFHQNRDIFLLTIGSCRRHLYIYNLK